MVHWLQYAVPPYLNTALQQPQVSIKARTHTRAHTHLIFSNGTWFFFYFKDEIHEQYRCTFSHLH